MYALIVIVIGSTVRQIPDGRVVAAGWLLDASGNVLALAAALTLIVGRGFNDLGGIIDTTVIASAVGGLLWAVALPHELGGDTSLAARVNLFVVVFALTGVLGALLRLYRALTERVSALRWLLVALGIGIGANVTLAFAGTDPEHLVVSQMLFMGAFVTLGLFGLDPTGPRLATMSVEAGTEELSTQRLVFLGVAVASVPVGVGVQEMLGGRVSGLVLAVQGAIVAILVMVRVGLLSAARARAETALVFQAAHDPLTQLPNRRTLITRLHDELARGRPCTLLYCDLDDFKAVNDRFGHAAGDQLLVEVADRIRACVARRHVVSRFGGDEFVILLIDATLTEAHDARACVAEAIARPFEAARGATVGVSVGLAGDGRDAEQLVRAADRAMYRAKAERAGGATATRPRRR
jgi:diguanylate cyclase (GGDEF)-like protein